MPNSLGFKTLLSSWRQLLARGGGREKHLSCSFVQTQIWLNIGLVEQPRHDFNASLQDMSLSLGGEVEDLKVRPGLNHNVQTRWSFPFHVRHIVILALNEKSHSLTAPNIQHECYLYLPNSAIKRALNQGFEFLSSICCTLHLNRLSQSFLVLRTMEIYMRS